MVVLGAAAAAVAVAVAVTVAVAVAVAVGVAVAVAVAMRMFSKSRRFTVRSAERGLRGSGELPWEWLYISPYLPLFCFPFLPRIPSPFCYGRPPAVNLIKRDLLGLPLSYLSVGMCVRSSVC
mgnify:CR=1 FL=1